MVTLCLGDAWGQRWESPELVQAKVNSPQESKTMLTHQVELPGRREARRELLRGCGPLGGRLPTLMCVLCNVLNACPFHLQDSRHWFSHCAAPGHGRKRGKLRVVQFSDINDAPSVVQTSPLFSKSFNSTSRDSVPIRQELPSASMQNLVAFSLLSAPLPLPVLDGSSKWNLVTFVLWSPPSGFFHLA